ncbi:MAG: class I SAM-dependent methyltransferase [Halobacteriovoraceae bacterium]|nr:class I SAM-dependent methyltransferase [Halobacteriovoraceae bacterium]
METVREERNNNTIIVDKKVFKESSLSSTQKIEDVDQAYNSSGLFYDLRGLCILVIAYRNFLFKQIRYFAKNIGTKHLEIAVGTGSLFELIYFYYRGLNFFRGSLPEIHGLDYATNMIKEARKRFSKRGNFFMDRMDASNMKYENYTFDTVNIANAVHSFPNPKECLLEIHRVMKDGGVLRMNILSNPSGPSFLKYLANKVNTFGLKKGILYKLYTLTEIENLMKECGFIISGIEKHGNCFYVECVKGKK